MTSEQCYVLPVTIIIETMKESSFLVQLQTYFSSLPNITKEPCVAELIVGQGKIHVCTIMTSTGHLLLEYEEAIACLQQCGSVEWDLLQRRRSSHTSCAGSTANRPTQCIIVCTGKANAACSNIN